MQLLLQLWKVEALTPLLGVERCSNARLRAHRLRSLSVISLLAIFSILGMTLPGCEDHSPLKKPLLGGISPIRAVDLSTPAELIFPEGGIQISVARNAWSDFALQLQESKLSTHTTLRLPTISGVAFDAYQILSVPVDLNDAEYVRQTGNPGMIRSIPRVLFPLRCTGGVVDLSSLNRATGSVLIWIDLHVTDTVAPGHLDKECVLSDGPSAWSLPVQITIENLRLPTEPHLHFTAGLEWSTLSNFYPELFQSVPVRLLDRGDPRRSNLVQLIDQYLQLAHENKADLYLPRLQPVVKWPLGKRPEVDWTHYDSMVSPWLNASAFADHRPVEFWPLPAPDALTDFNLSNRVEYWHEAAQHFQQHGWLGRSPVVLDRESSDPVSDAGSILLSAQAGQILASDSKITTLVPMEDTLVQVASPQNPNAIAMQSVGRLISATQGLIHSAPSHATGLPPHKHFLDATDGVIPAVSEQGMRSLAWTAFGNKASMIRFANPMPTLGNQPIHAGELNWIYPGELFGVDHPLATVQLKWMRQAEQDYEYLMLASSHQTDASKICNLQTKPVQLDASQVDIASFWSLAGNSDPHGCENARQLLINQLAHIANAAPLVDPVDLQTLRWFGAGEKQTLLVDGVNWKWDQNTVNAAVNVEVYNPAADMPDGCGLQWAQAPAAWSFPNQPSTATPTPALYFGQYHVTPATATARLDLTKISAQSSGPIDLNLTDNFTRQTVNCRIMLPVAVSERRKRALSLDGLLNEWFAADAIQLNQPLVNVVNRPAVQAGTLEYAKTPSSIYSAWSEDHFYLAFRLGGVSAADLRSTRNFVQYDHGRAWGEDLCELLIQPVYIDNSTGPLLHIVCKPGGSWVEQQVDTNAWQPFEACGLRYASGVDSAQNVWRGEVAIPWKAINKSGHGRPALLRFNFIQHQQATAQSASWAGPVDQSRDGKLTGLLFLKDP